MPEAAESLDRLASEALAGRAGAESALFEGLRVRFLAVAKRRLREDELEDVVQDALGIVHSRYGERPSPTGILPWSYTVLRNVIGNRYQSRRREEGREEFREEVHSAFPGIEEGGLEEAELRGRIARAIRAVGAENPRCGAIFRRILESLDGGGGAREISRRAREAVQDDVPGITSGNFYVILHRCRDRLRKALKSLEGEEE